MTRSEDLEAKPTGVARARRSRPRDDRELVAEVLADPTGPLWRDVMGPRLFGYAHRSLLNWARAGTLRHQARDVRGISRVPQNLRLDVHQADWLVAEILAAALRTFVRTSLPGWDPDGGRSLDAYFMTWCFMKLPDAHDAWRRRETSQMVVQLSPDDHGRPADDRPLPEDVVALRDAVQQLCAADPLVHRILLLRLDGATVADIDATMAREGVLKSEVTKARRRLTDFVERHEQADAGE